MVNYKDPHGVLGMPDEDEVLRDVSEAQLEEERRAADEIIAVIGDAMVDEPPPVKVVWQDFRELVLNLLRTGDGQEYGVEDLFGLVHEFIEASDRDSINHWTFRVPEDLATRVSRANSLIANANNLEELQLLLQKVEYTLVETARARELSDLLMRSVRHDTLEFSRLLLSTGIRLGSRPVQPGD